MVRTKRAEHPQTRRNTSSGPLSGPMDGFLSTPAGPTHEAQTPNMAPTSPISTCSSSDGTTLADIGVELERIATAMVTKDDLTHLSSKLHEAIKTEMADLKGEIKAQETRILQLEQKAQTAEDHSTATDTALKRQGALLLAMRRQLEDQDNRGRRNNIRVRGIPEPTEGGGNIEEILTPLFRIILREEAPAHIKYDRAHRALQPRLAEGTPRDIICCLHSFPLKELIMAKARPRPLWNYRGAEVSLYNDLSPLTLEARRALRPITTILREKNMPYKWDYPFSITVRHNNEWVSAR
ncbi:Hypothetical predicted protein [Pelobates cultripes]|uniref:Transposase n=1 Tax=Pelobates cultripes TaxID=61616 RepID=A0AAD1S0Y9_PELCU|nr:Hypothetical predicted protein [Pelobates cultripes]